MTNREKVKKVFELGKELCDQLEAFKHCDQTELLEVRLLAAILEAEDAFTSMIDAVQLRE